MSPELLLIALYLRQQNQPNETPKQLLDGVKGDYKKMRKIIERFNARQAGVTGQQLVDLDASLDTQLSSLDDA